MIGIAAIEYNLENGSVEEGKFNDYKNYVQLFYSISINSCAVAMILFAGRLENSVMGAPLPLVFIFYLYGVSQFLSYDSLSSTKEFSIFGVISKKNCNLPVENSQSKKRK